ncbi:BrnA antitoxin family protein [Primorskyibacter flagellatus]|uniref:BrnA antitoxin family protein n=1 Tax=Primorskyibacter flagellatus TaxID=1387277 RepID=UPI003A8E605B
MAASGKLAPAARNENSQQDEFFSSSDASGHSRYPLRRGWLNSAHLLLDLLYCIVWIPIARCFHVSSARGLRYPPRENRFEYHLFPHRLDWDVVATLKATKPGWQSRINNVFARLDWVDLGFAGKQPALWTRIQPGIPQQVEQSW